MDGAKLIARATPKLLELAWNYCENTKLEQVVHSSYAPKRKEKWLRFGSNLQSIQAGRHRLFDASEPPNWMTTIGNHTLPGWHSILVCGGKTDKNN